VTSIAWFHSEKNIFFTSSLDKTIRLWRDYETVSVLKKHSDWIRCLSLNRTNEKLLSGCVASKIYEWDVETSQVIFSLQNQNEFLDASYLNSINSLVYSNTNSNIFGCASRDGFIRVYDSRKGKEPVFCFLGHGSIDKPAKMNQIEFTFDDSCIVSSGRDSTIRLWDFKKLTNQNFQSDKEYEKFKKGAVIREFKDHKCSSYNVNCMLFNEEENIITGSEDKKVYIYDINTGKVLKTLGGHNSVVHLVHCRDKSVNPFRFVSSSIDSGSIHFWSPSFDENKSDKIEFIQEDSFTVAHRNFIETLVEKYGDRILELFHKHNYTFSSGSLDSFLLRLISELTQQEGGFNPNNPELMSLLEIFQQICVDYSATGEEVGQEEVEEEEEEEDEEGLYE
jgi:WD40 repeat protein